MLDWKKHKLESIDIARRNINNLRYHPYGRKWRRTKEPFDDSESEVG